MWLKRISILNYKNLEQVELAFSHKMNCIIGKNGMGKTNLLDAVYYLSFCKSATNAIDSQNILHDRDFFVVQGFYETDQGEPEEVYCGLKRRQKKQFKRNKKEYSRLSDQCLKAPGTELPKSIIDGEYIIYDLTKALAQAVLLPVPRTQVHELSYEELCNMKSERMDGKMGSSEK